VRSPVGWMMVELFTFQPLSQERKGQFCVPTVHSTYRFPAVWRLDTNEPPLHLEGTMRVLSIHSAAASMALLAVILLVYPGHVIVHGFSSPSSTVSRRVTSSSSTYSSYVSFSRPIGSHYHASPKQSTRLYMGWGPEPIWSTATVSRNIQACPSATCVSLFVDVEDGNDFIFPGQYVQVRPVGGE
jgi:hypothetical protein